jgi:hypothetical protein
MHGAAQPPPGQRGELAEGRTINDIAALLNQILALL